MAPVIDLQPFEWIVVLGAFFAFFTAFGIGANDVANAFATSVGSKALTIRDAMIIAAVFEFAGAVILGASVSDTIRKKIADLDCFLANPAQLMWGMMCVVLCTGIWLYLATYLELPVSTTHSTVGGVIGFTLVAAGPDCVAWVVDGVPDVIFKGVVGIVMSWIFSPVLSALVAAIIFYITRTFVLRKEDSSTRAYNSFPVFVYACCAIIFSYILVKGAGSKMKEWFSVDTKKANGFGIAVGFAFLFALVPLGASFFVKPRIKREMDATSDEPEEVKPSEVVVDAKEVSDNKPKGILGYVRSALETDVDALVAENATVNEIHATAEKFAPKTEVVFRYMQILTACLDSFAHGANDVANAMGPYAAIYFTYRQNGIVGSKVGGDDMYWILAIGGFGIVVGLGVYGYKIMYAIGVKLAKITPSRGFAIELGAMIVVITGTVLGIPLSTTHCQVGATMGVAGMEGRLASTNWLIVGKTVLGWIFTMVVNGCFVAAIFAIGDNTIDYCAQFVSGAPPECMM